MSRRRRCGGQSRSDDNGFTLIELLVVVVILRLSKGAIGVVACNGPIGYCVAAHNTKDPADPTAPDAAYGFGFKTYYYASTSGTISDLPCIAPSGATPFDNHYVDDTGGH